MSGGSEALGANVFTLHGLETVYSPADFADAEDSRPSEAYLDPTASGTLLPYSTIVMNVLTKHTQEVKEKVAIQGFSVPAWRKRIRDFLVHNNEQLLGFLRKPLSSHPVLSQAEPFLKRFGRPDFHPTHSSLHQILFDTSGQALVPILEAEMKRLGPSSFSELTDQIKWMYDTYKQAGEDVMRNEAILKTRLATLDSTYQKIVLFLDLPTNEHTEDLTTSIEKYMKRVFEENSLQEAYSDYIVAYRRFVSLKEIIGFLRSVEIADKEPLCSICLHDTITHTLVPCGHTFCSTCSRKQMTQCYMCRSQIRERIKIFFC